MKKLTLILIILSVTFLSTNSHAVSYQYDISGTGYLFNSGVFIDEEVTYNGTATFDTDLSNFYFDTMLDLNSYITSTWISRNFTYDINISGHNGTGNGDLSYLAIEDIFFNMGDLSTGDIGSHSLYYSPIELPTGGYGLEFASSFGYNFAIMTFDIEAYKAGLPPPTGAKLTVTPTVSAVYDNILFSNKRVVPEPSTMLLLGSGLLGLVGLRKKFKK